MKKIIIFLLFIANISFAQNVDTLLLSDCYTLAADNYPLSKGKHFMIATTGLKTENFNSTFKPQVTLGGQANYQSDVTKVNIPIPNLKIDIPSPAHDQYKLHLDVSQLIFDGGAVKSQKDLELLSLAADTLKISVDVYAIREKINTLYFSILNLQENEKLIKISKNEIEKRVGVVESGFKNGILLESDLDVINAELLKIEQQLLDIQIRKQTAIEVLSKYLGKKISQEISFKLPEKEISIEKELKRPETQVFEMQQRKLDASAKLLSTKMKPKLAAFGQLGYANPALNMFNNEFDDYYIVGAKFSWTLWDWEQNKREKLVLSLGKDIIATQRATFNLGIDIALQNELAAIERLEKTIVKDKEIIALRAKITKAYSSQLENGVINSTDYLTQLNAETQARINLQSHEIQLVQAKTNYNTIKGE